MYQKPKEETDENGEVTAMCQCGVRKPIKELSKGYAGWTEISKPCYHCDDCIPF